jgi:enoyl-CoA hydratase/carnithine racemase
MLKTESAGPVLRLTLDRPEVRNALNAELIAGLSNAFSDVPSEIRAIVLTGEGPSFCAGGDLEWMRKAAGYTEDENFQDALRLARLFEAMVQCPALIIARVNGHAFGGATGLVAASDVAISSREALFAFSEVRLGLVPATISPYVIEKIGSGHARALFTTGETFGAEHALRIGLVHHLCDPGQLDQVVGEKLRAVLAAGPKAVSNSKRIAREQTMSSDASARLLARTRAGDEAREGIAAFLEKRKAAFVTEL